MFKCLRKNIAALVAGLALVAVPLAVAVPATVSAQAPPQSGSISEQLKCGSNLSVDASNGCDVQEGTQGVNKLITDIINIFSIVVGIISVIMIIYGGFRYVISGGESGNVSSAKSTIIYAIIGLVVVALAQFVVQFVLDKVTDA